MEKRTEGAWIVNHTTKLQEVGVNEFEDIEIAGKCGLLLSNLAADADSDLTKEKVDIIAKISGVKKIEVGVVISKLIDEKLIIKNGGNFYVLGVTTSSVLEHTANIFNDLAPNKIQNAVLELSEVVSACPLEERSTSEYISDTFQLSSKDTSKLFKQAEEAGLIDYEIVDSEKIYFNGNLFRKEDVKKTKAILDTLNEGEARSLSEFENQLRNAGCVSLEYAINILGQKLLDKLHSIGMYDFNQVSNDNISKVFLTRPAAFSKYGKPFEDDALDLAKAFVASLSYGIQYSSFNRGKITMLQRLLRKLITGGEVGPCTAIGQDYRILELKRVIQLRHEGGSMYYMKLLKREIGVLALQVLETGDASDQSVLNMVSGNVTDYKGPETLRAVKRKKLISKNESTIVDQLRILRK